MASDDELTIHRILRHYNDLPFRAFYQATPVQVLTAFHHLILKIHPDLGFNFSTVNGRTHQRFCKTMAVLGLESCTPSLTSITRSDKPVLIRAFNALVDLIECRHTRLPSNEEGSPVPQQPKYSTSTLPRSRSKRMSLLVNSSLSSGTGLPKPRSNRMSIVTTSSLRPPLVSPSQLLTPRRSFPLSSTPLRKSSISTPLHNPASFAKNSMTMPSTPARSQKPGTSVKVPRPIELQAQTSKPPQSTSILVTPRAIKARLSLLPTNTPVGKIPSLRQPRKSRPSIASVIMPAKLPEGFDQIENPFKTQAKLKSTPVASRAASLFHDEPKVVPLQLEQNDPQAFQSKCEVARTPDLAPISNGIEPDKALDKVEPSTSQALVPARSEPSVQLSSLYERFLITDKDDNLPLRTIRKLIQAQKTAEQNSVVKSSSDTQCTIKKVSSTNICEPDDKENRREVRSRRKTKKSLDKTSAVKDSAVAIITEKRPVRRGRNQTASSADVYDDPSDDELVREASALLQRCELAQRFLDEGTDRSGPARRRLRLGETPCSFS